MSNQNTPLPDVLEMCQKAQRLCNDGQIAEAVKLTLEIESKAASYADEREHALCKIYVSPCLIDIGSAAHDEAMIRRGTQYLVEYHVKYPQEIMDEPTEFWNIGNGYLSAWSLKAKDYFLEGVDADDHRLARKYYRRAIDYYMLHMGDRELISKLLTNYGNTLDSVCRCFEAIDSYEVALRVNPDMGMALGNKAIALIFHSRLMPTLRHRFYLESHRLLKKALQLPLSFDARKLFTEHINYLEHFIKQHGDMIPESIEFITPASDFHKFLCNFCAKHLLFLSPVTFLGEEEKTFYGDPMFIENMIVPLAENDKADRYVTFLNEIKQDYVFGRYMLVQSQYHLPNLDVVDEGVNLIYPLDYSLHSIYIQFLKAAMKQAISVLDKVAYFIYDYCKMSTTLKSKSVSFKIISNDRSPKMREILSQYENIYLFALHSLSRDLSKDGDWEDIYENRDALTHRYLVLHDIDLGERQANKDIPRENLDTFTKRVIHATKIARSAVMYLILFVAEEEAKAQAKINGIIPPIDATPLDKGFRHKPPFGE